MRRMNHGGGALVAAVAVAFAGSAEAQDARVYPVRVAPRPITLARRALRVDADLSVLRVADAAGGGDGITYLTVGLGYGISSDFEFGATVLPLQLTESFVYRNPSLYLRYRFFRSNEVQVGGDLGLTLPGLTGPLVGAQVGVPFVYADPRFRFETGVFYALSVYDSVDHRIFVPAVFKVSVTDHFHLGVSTGVRAIFGTGGGQIVPLGIELGYAFARSADRPVVDIVPYFTFPNFLARGTTDFELATNLWSVGVNVRVFAFL